MRRRPVAGMTLAGTLVALLSACAAQPTATVNGIQIETELSATELRHGDSVLVHVLVTNTATGPRTIPASR